MTGAEGSRSSGFDRDAWQQYCDAKNERGRELVARLAQNLDPETRVLPRPELRDLADDILFEAMTYVVVGGNNSEQMRYKMLGAHHLLDWLLGVTDNRGLGNMSALLEDAEARSIPKPPRSQGHL